MRRFFIPAANIDNGKVVIDGGDFHHLSHVLRKGIGDTIDATDGWGNFLKIKLTEIYPDSLQGIIIEKIPVSERKLSLTLYQAIPRQGIFDTIVEKAVELGVKRIVPVITDRTIVRLDDERGDKKLARWKKIAGETVKKVGRADEPEIMPVCKLKDIGKNLIPGSLRITAWEMEESLTLKSFLRTAELPGQVETVIGPEGGLTAEENEFLIDLGFHAVTLGKRILRVETAAVSIISNIFYELDL